MFGIFIFSLLMLKNKENLQEIEALCGKHNMVARSHGLSPFQFYMWHWNSTHAEFVLCTRFISYGIIWPTIDVFHYKLSCNYKFQPTERIKSVYKGQGCKIKMKFELNMARDPLTKYCYYLNYLFDCNIQNSKKILETLVKGRTQGTCLSN